MALLAGGLPGPPALLGARRRYRGSEGTQPPATDRLCRSPPQHLLVSPAASALLLHRISQRRGQRTSLLVTLAAAGAAAAGSDRQEQPQQTFQQRLAAAAAQASKSKKKQKKKPLPARLLSSFLATSSVPYSSYVPEPATLLHGVHARAKLFLLLAILLLAARSPPGVRAALAGLVAASTLAILPARLALPQLRRVLMIAGFIFFLTAIGAESVPPPLQSRCPPGVEAGLAACPPAIGGCPPAIGGGGGGGGALLAASASRAPPPPPSSVDFFAAVAAAEDAVASKARSYSYVVFHFLFVTVTRRSLRLATSAAATCLLALQGSSLVLTTTPAEDAALALCTLPSWKRGRRGKARSDGDGGGEDGAEEEASPSPSPNAVRRPANRTALTLLLSLRFLSLVFDETRGLALGLAARGIDWEGLGSGGGVTVGLRLVTRLFGNLQARAGDVAVAMTARGFAGPGLHIVHPAAVPGPVGGGGGSKGAARVSFGATLCAVLLACAALARAAVSSPA